MCTSRFKFGTCSLRCTSCLSQERFDVLKCLVALDVCQLDGHKGHSISHNVAEVRVLVQHDCIDQLCHLNGIAPDICWYCACTVQHSTVAANRGNSTTADAQCTADNEATLSSALGSAQLQGEMCQRYAKVNLVWRRCTTLLQQMRQGGCICVQHLGILVFLLRCCRGLPGLQGRY